MKVFSLETFVEWSSTKDHGNQKAKFAKNIQNQLFRINIGDKADTSQKCS